MTVSAEGGLECGRNICGSQELTLRSKWHVTFGTAQSEVGLYFVFSKRFEICRRRLSEPSNLFLAEASSE
ncbi:hypothetical protein X749_31415 [Mesorhizobium sp. LNJC391B00]|nr:hypothetical protein X749_31415 [Mesorhizobium sp. LNJC391B00]